MEWVISDHHCDLSNMFTYDIYRQSVVDKMVREISLEVGEKSGNLFLNFWWEPSVMLDSISNIAPDIAPGLSLLLWGDINLT